MKYSSLRQCVSDLERTGRLVSIEESVDPNLEMAAIHLRVFRAGGPALLFKNVKNSPFPAVSNLFGTRERTEFIFRSTLSSCRKIMNLKKNPASFFSSPLSNAFNLKNAFPKKTGFLPVLKHSTPAHSLPAIKSWPKDGGGFMTLPLVYSEDPTRPGIRFSNLGMYRIQMNGNDYEAGKEFGLHYQIHRGIGIHQTKAKEGGAPLKVSVFAGGPPSFTLAAVMPLPEDLPEIAFAGLLGGRRFRYNHKQGFFIPGEADFLITGTVDHDITKPEGPFGDHLGYYSLKHPYPVLKIENVYHRSGAIWPFTVVGRPPMEDSIFGWLIHELTGDLIPSELPGVREVNAVDEAGVHPLLLAIGKERYTPFENKQRPMELLTQANKILGTGQLSLAKYLFITDPGENKNLSTKNIPGFFSHVLERIDFTRDLHFQTQTTIDTLDYSGTDVNAGSKVIFAAHGNPVRSLAPNQDALPAEIKNLVKMIIPGVGVAEIAPFTDYETAAKEISGFAEKLKSLGGGYFTGETRIPLIIISDDKNFTAASLANFLWNTFTRSNPSHDIYGIDSGMEFKHWYCRGSLIIDARAKPHHAPVLEESPEIKVLTDRLFKKGGPLEKWSG